MSSSTVSLGGMPADSPIRKTLSYDDIAAAGSGESSDEDGLPTLEETMESFKAPSGAREAMQARRAAKCGHKYANGVYAGRVCGRQVRAGGRQEPDGVARCVTCAVEAKAVALSRKYDDDRAEHQRLVITLSRYGQSSCFRGNRFLILETWLPTVKRCLLTTVQNVCLKLSERR